MATAPANDSKEHWHLDKKVPITLLMVLIAQFGGMAMYVAGLKNQSDENTRRITTLEVQIQKIPERLASLEAQMTDTRSTLNRIESKVDRLNERTSK